ncbi:S-adenosylmethionine synthetase [Candidatus Phytoplasma mali]|uniref:Methionine adenosyltransferase n=1 Tax=Phytoplasma mali (strain AT) TaxID=482235 RepID=B3QZU6_PHYMT|nr:methionine adenosyltransferase [Candidatus Phytoplasma mali]CAP18483.1 S-adenosylmethionine synthetase [Candidatus Phytoplasma mali]
MQKFTSESVTKGHPDKVADQISDALLDAFLEQKKDARVAIETIVTAKTVFILGEVEPNIFIDYNNIIKKIVRSIGYDRREENFSYQDLKIINKIHSQSKEISLVVDKNVPGDQGLMFGYATNETLSFLPLGFDLSKKLSLRLTEVRENKILPFLRPDGKTQITMVYDFNNNPLYIDSIVISSQHEANIDRKILVDAIKKEVIMPVIDNNFINSKTNYYINPAGSFINGGPNADTGLTGRKIIVDTYGGYSRHGGGSFSGKDSSKVDRSASYMARYLAKNIVASGICDICEIQISYAIGIENPMGIYINTFNTNKVSEKLILQTIKNNFDLRLKGIIQKLDLQNPIYQQTASEGHFGNYKHNFSWEKIDKKNIFEKLF